MIKELKRIYLQGWHDDIGVRKWSWLATLGIGILLGIAMSIESRWLFLVCVIAALTIAIGMARDKKTKKGGKP